MTTRNGVKQMIVSRKQYLLSGIVIKAPTDEHQIVRVQKWCSMAASKLCKAGKK